MGTSSSRRPGFWAPLVLVAQVHGAEPALGPAALENLKQAYLMCDREATMRLLAPAEAAACSEVAEQLLQRGFDGDFDRLLAWWRSARLPTLPERDERPRR